MGNLMKQAQQMQDKMAKMQEDMAKVEVVGESGAGLVKVIMLGNHNVRKVEIDDSLVGEDKEMLEDLVVAAINNAVSRVEQNNRDHMSKVTGGIEMPPGFKMPF